MQDRADGPAEGPVRNIVIVGGGTAGWMAAAYLTRALNASGAQVDITLVASADIGTIGVGEGTVPSIRPVFFDFLGIPEADWMAASNAGFKFGIKFVNWGTPSAAHFYHTFGEAREIDGIPITHFWLQKTLAGFDQPFAHACYTTAALCDADRAPKRFGAEAQAPHAYHFDAQLLTAFLKDWAVARGVEDVTDEIADVQLTAAGEIASLRGKSGRTYTADLYLDCSGLPGLLIRGALHEPFESYGESLLCDRAIAIRLPHPDGERIRPYTTATAQDAGWTWEIDLPGRSGNGYVYSSRFVSDDDAETALRAFLGPRAAEASARRLQWRIGRNRRAWAGNCVSLGLAGGFLEPLEATSIYFVFAALHYLVRYFPNAAIAPPLRDKFNERVAYMYDDVRDFLVLHYCTTQREDTPFWRANKHELHVPDRVRTLLKEYRAGVPIKLPYTGAAHYNELVFDASFDRFWTNSNYVAILAGMGVLPEAPMPLLRFLPDAVRKAEAVFADIEQTTARLLAELPPHADYLAQLRADLPPGTSAL